MIMQEELKVSVAMSVYKNDNPAFLKESLDSLCSQSRLPDEIYVVIDGPIPKELETVIESYCSRYDFFTLNYLEKNGGLGNALNIAIINCKYDLIIRMDSDDICAPNRIKTLIQEYKKEPTDVLGSWTLGFFGDFENATFSKYTNKLSDFEIKKNIGKSSPVSHVSVLLNRNSVLKAGNYQDLFYHEDYFLWARMIKEGCSFRNIPFFLVYVRCGEDQAKRHGGRKYYAAEKCLRKYLLSNKLISLTSYLWQLFIRFIYMILMPPKMRCFVDKKFKRKYISSEEAKRIIEENKKACIFL